MRGPPKKEMLWRRLKQVLPSLVRNSVLGPGNDRTIVMTARQVKRASHT